MHLSPDILILDEATSHLDQATEAQFLSRYISIAQMHSEAFEIFAFRVSDPELNVKKATIRKIRGWGASNPGAPITGGRHRRMSSAS